VQSSAGQSTAPKRTAEHGIETRQALCIRGFGEHQGSNNLPRHNRGTLGKETEMAIQQAKIIVTGISPLLQNNPQTVDPFCAYAKAKKAITAKRTSKTDDDLIELGNIETESKIYFDDALGVYIPATWLTEAIICTGFSVAKIGRARMRGGLFATESKIALNYRDKKKVKTITDVVMNPVFRHRMLLKQGQVRVPKDAPIFHDWSFSTVVEFDDTVVDFGSLRRIVERSAKYGGFGDFRPTFGRATAEVLDV
jgi:hypothetical protein